MSPTCVLCQQRDQAIDDCCAECWLTLAKLSGGTVITPEALELARTRRTSSLRTNGGGY